MKISNKKYLLFLLYLSSSFIQNCSDPISTDNNRVYRGKFTDYINVVANSDTVNIIFEQKEVGYNQKESIPFRIIENRNDSLIKFNLFGHYESYSENPKTVKEIEDLRDTLFVRYYHYNKYYKLSKITNSVAIENNAAPILEYVMIDSIIVEKNFNKTLNLKSKFMSGL